MVESAAKTPVTFQMGQLPSGAKPINTAVIDAQRTQFARYKSFEFLLSVEWRMVFILRVT